MTLGNTALAMLATPCGAVFALMNPRATRLGDCLDSVFAAAALGIPFWGAVSVVTLSSLAGQGPQWTAEGMRALFPALLGWVVAGFLLGALTPLARWLVERWLGPDRIEQPAVSAAEKKRILILGGG